jgi:zinc/manganese transport system substrate-binding protein
MDISMKTWYLAAILCGAVAVSSVRPVVAAPVSVVAAENMYGDIVGQLAGSHASVTSILSNPDEDPHLFEASVSVGKQLAGAKIVVMNGVGYDPWMNGLLNATKVPARQVIDVATLVHAHDGDNPHLWYRLDAIQALADAVTQQLIAIDPADKAEFKARSANFRASLAPIKAKIAQLRSAYAGVPVTATEPVFGYMAAAIGLKMHNEGFQLAVMNNTEPSVSQTAAMEADLRGHTVRVLIYNSQATDTAAQHLLSVAKAAGVPVIGVTETEPKGRIYQPWMSTQLDALQVALQTARQTVSHPAQ